MTRKPAAIPITHNGITYPSITALCRAHKINPKLFRARRKKGLSVEECLSQSRRNATQVEHAGVVYESVAALCMAYDIDPQTFYRRRNAGLDMDACLAEGRTYNVANGTNKR